MAGAREGSVGPRVGGEFAAHRIDEVIGRGGMGVVYRALNLGLNRERAVKVIAPELSTDERFRERFKRESRLAASIEHPNVIPVHAAGEEAGFLYLSMRLVEGSDLRRIVESDGPLEPARAAAIITGVAAALDAAHAAGLVHRDVKPANVLIEPGASGELVFLTDFGITRPARPGETVTGTGEFVGSPDYVAPEQAAGEPVSPRTDTYALGCVAYFALTGSVPFVRENDLATLFAHANAPRPRPSAANPELPAGVDDVIARAMATEPSERHGSAGDFAAELRRALGVPSASAEEGREAAATPTRRIPERAGYRRAGRRGAIVTGSALALAAIVAALLLLTQGDDPPSEPVADRDGTRTEAGSPAPPRASATIPVGEQPNGLTLGGGRVWVAETGARQVQAVDPDREEAVPPAFAVPGASSVAVGFGSVWAVSPGENAVYRLDPSGEAEPVVIGVGSSPSDIAVDEDWVWVSNQGDNTVSRVDPGANEEDLVEPVGVGPRSLATGGGSVWVANIDARSVSEIDANSAERVGSAIPVTGSRPNDVAFGEGSVWVIDNVDGTLSRIDPRRQAVEGRPTPVGPKPRGVKVAFGHVWTANAGDGTLSRIDPERLELVGRPTKVGRDPADVAVGEGAIWTVNQADSTVTRVEP